MANDYEPISDAEMVSQIKAELVSANYEADSRLIEQRSEADLAYTGQYTPGLEPNTGMSSILINPLQPAIDTLTTYLTKIFTSDKETVVFHTDDEEMADEARDLTRIINDKIHKQNNGYYVLSRWIKDAMLHKTGVVKVVWDDTPEYYKFKFAGTEDELAAELMKKEEEGYECTTTDRKFVTTTLTAVSETSGESVEIANESLECNVRCEKPRNQPRLINIPPEEFYINEGARQIDDEHTRFVAQQQLMYKSDVKEMFPDATDDDLKGGSGFLLDEYETAARHAYDGTFDYNQDSSTSGPLQYITVIEAWIRADVDGDGVAEWRHVFVCGSTLLQNDEWYGPIPIAAYTPIPVPFKFYGLGIWDKLRDYQRTKTGLVRAAIDSANNKNIVRYFGDPRTIDARGLRSGKPGLISVTPAFNPDTLVPVPTGSGAVSESVTLLQYLDKEIIAQIGIDPVTGMISTDVEKSGNDAAKTGLVIDNSSAKVEGYARELAETGLKDIIWIIYDMMIQYGRLPDMNYTKADLSAKVGLGHQTQTQKLQAAQAIIQQQNVLESSPIAPIPIPPANKLEASKYLAKALGETDVDRFFPSADEVNAERQRIQEQQSQAAQAEQQIKEQALQMELQGKQATIAKDMAQAQKIAAEANGAARMQELAEERAVVDIQNVNADNEREVRRIEGQEEQMVSNTEMQGRKIDLERELGYVKADTDIKVANIKAGISDE